MNEAWESTKVTVYSDDTSSDKQAKQTFSNVVEDATGQALVDFGKLLNGVTESDVTFESVTKSTVVRYFD